MPEETLAGLGEGPAQVISVSLPEGTVRVLREVAGKRGMSALVATALEQHLRDLATAAYLDEYEQEHGAFTDEERQSAARVWADAEVREAQWRAAG